MRTFINIKTETDNVGFGIWNAEKEEFTPLEQMSNDEIKETLQINDSLLETLKIFQADLRDSVSNDLRDIWRRLDKAGL